MVKSWPVPSPQSRDNFTARLHGKNVSRVISCPQGHPIPRVTLPPEPGLQFLVVSSKRKERRCSCRNAHVRTGNRNRVVITKHTKYVSSVVHLDFV